MTAIRIAYPGAAGSYTAEAAARLHPVAELFSAGQFEDVVEAVRSGAADQGVLPIENSLAGLVPETFDLLADGELPIVAEAVMHIPNCLAGVPGSVLEQVTDVYSHPVALQQCRRYLGRRFEQHGASTTSDAVRLVAEAGDPSRAAIASPSAAARYGLVVLDPDISDHPENFTRFVSITRGSLPAPSGEVDWHTALRIVTRHEPGALHDAIEPFRYHRVNMVSLHSRPIRGEPWRYQFYVDIAGHPAADETARALDDVRARSALLVVLGAYAAAARNGA